MSDDGAPVRFRELGLAGWASGTDLGRRLVEFQKNVADGFRQVKNKVDTVIERIETVETSIVSLETPMLWKWNGIDTTQFEASTSIADGYTGSPSLTVSADSRSSSAYKLVITGSSGGGGGYLVGWLARATLPGTRYIMEYTMLSASPNAHGGPMLLSDPTTALNTWGYLLSQTGAASVICYQNGTLLGSGIPAATVGTPPMRVTLELTANKAVGAAPLFRAGAAHVQHGGAGVLIANNTVGFDDTTHGALGSSWNAKPCRRFGIGMSLEGIFATSQSIAICDWSIRKHPLDASAELD